MLTAEMHAMEIQHPWSSKVKCVAEFGLVFNSVLFLVSLGHLFLIYCMKYAKHVKNVYFEEGHLLKTSLTDCFD